MGNWYDLYQEYLDMPKSKRVSIAKTCAAIVLDDLEKNCKDYTQAFINAVATFVLADGVVNRDECELFNDIVGTNVAYDDFYELVNTDRATIEAFDKYIDSRSNEVKYAFVTLGICICACNGTMTVKEKELIEKYFY